MPWMFVLGSCWFCKGPMTFNPEKVPSLPIDPVTGLTPDLGGDPGRATREPLCRVCVEKANVMREAAGLEAFAIHPDAYEPEEVM